MADDLAALEAAVMNAGQVATAAMDSLSNMAAIGTALKDATDRYPIVVQHAIEGRLEDGEQKLALTQASEAAIALHGVYERFVRAIAAMDALVSAVAKLNAERRRISN